MAQDAASRRQAKRRRRAPSRVHRSDDPQVDAREAVREVARRMLHGGAATHAGNVQGWAKRVCGDIRRVRHRARLLRDRSLHQGWTGAAHRGATGGRSARAHELARPPPQVSTGGFLSSREWRTARRAVETALPQGADRAAHYVQLFDAERHARLFGRDFGCTRRLCRLLHELGRAVVGRDAGRHGRSVGCASRTSLSTT